MDDFRVLVVVAKHILLQAIQLIIPSTAIGIVYEVIVVLDKEPSKKIT